MDGRSISERAGEALAAAATLLLLASVAGSFTGISPLFDTIGALRPQFALAGILVLVAAALLRAPVLAAAAGTGALALNLAVMAPHYPPLGTLLPARAQPGADGGGLTLLHFNTWRHNERRGEIPAFLREQAADIVVLLEATPELVAELATLDDLYPHRADCARSARCAIAVLSRQPLEAVKLIPRAVGAGQDAPPIGIVRVAGVGPTLVIAHPDRPFPWERQGPEMAALIRLLKTVPGPVILTGDFNAAPWSGALQRIHQHTGLVRAARTWGTWPSPLGVFGIPIDHILTSPGIAVADAVALPSPGSDHRAVLARLLPAGLPTGAGQTR